MTEKKRINPFYVLLCLCGTAFVVTATAYGVMMLQRLHPQRTGEVSEAGIRMMSLLDRHGMAILIGELAALAAFSALAVIFDEYGSGKGSRTPFAVGDPRAVSSGEPPPRESRLPSPDSPD